MGWGTLLGPPGMGRRQLRVPSPHRGHPNPGGTNAETPNKEHSSREGVTPPSTREGSGGLGGGMWGTGRGGEFRGGCGVQRCPRLGVGVGDPGGVPISGGLWGVLGMSPFRDTLWGSRGCPHFGRAVGVPGVPKCARSLPAAGRRCGREARSGPAHGHAHHTIFGHGTARCVYWPRPLARGPAPCPARVPKAPRGKFGIFGIFGILQHPGGSAGLLSLLIPLLSSSSSSRGDH